MKKTFAVLVVVVLLLWWLRGPRSPELSGPAALQLVDKVVDEEALSKRSVVGDDPTTTQPALPVVDESSITRSPRSDLHSRAWRPNGYPQVTIVKNSYFDRDFGVLLVGPEGWSIARVVASGEDQSKTTVRFKPRDESPAIPRVFYELYPDGESAPADPESYMRMLATTKETNRRRSAGFEDYTNDQVSFRYREIGGRPSQSYFSTFVANNEIQTEYILQVLGPEGYVTFYIRGPVEDVQTQIPAILEMAEDVVPPRKPAPAPSGTNGLPGGG